MRGKELAVVVLFVVAAVSGQAGNLALLRGATVTTASAPGGPSAVKLTPITPNGDVYVLVLSDSLTSEDLPRLRRDISVAFTTTFLGAHPLHFVTVLGTGTEVSGRLASSAQLKSALNHIDAATATQASGLDLINALGSVASTLPGNNWAHVVVIGRFPAFARDEVWVTAWLGEVFRSRRLRLSFWSLDGSAPNWAQNLAAASLGTVSTSTADTLLPTLNDDSVDFEAAWECPLTKGAWPYKEELRNAAGEVMTSFVALASAPNFLPPLTAYLTARAAMETAAPADEISVRKTLELNPADADALHRLAAFLEEQGKSKESVAVWRELSEVTPVEGSVWAELGITLFAAGSLDESARAIDRATALGVKNRSALEARSNIYFRKGDFSDALRLTDEALSDKTSASAKASQSLWLLRADCARGLKRWPIEAESLEHAAAVAPMTLDRSTRLISGYLAANDTAHALQHLREVTDRLPPEAPIRAQYARFWEVAGDPSAAETLWRTALEADPKFEPAYLGLARHYMDAHRANDALHVADSGLNAIPSSLLLVLAKEDALETLGDIYGARRLLNERAPGSHDSELLKRHAFLEDAYGSAAPEAYAALLGDLVQSEAPQSEVVELCRRGLIVSLRDERPELAKTFADKLAAAGDRAGLDLLKMEKSSESSSFELLGGVDAFNFLIFGGGTNQPDRILVDYSRTLSATAPEPSDYIGRKEWLSLGVRVHEYFQILRALAALGERKQGRIEISLTLTNKAGKQRTGKVFGILGLKLKSNKERVTVKSAEGKSEVKKQDTLAALAIDDGAIQQALASGKTYRLDIPIDSVLVFPSVEYWQRQLTVEQYKGGLAEALFADPRIARLFYAINSMDRATAKVLVQSVPPQVLAERYSSALWLYAAALAINGTAAEAPGGPSAIPTWERFTGVSPRNPVPFFEALLDKDDGRLIAFFYSLSQLDFQHQQFFTRSPERLKRFYDLFRDSAEMHRGGERRIGGGSFLEFLREVPLNPDLSVDFPGSAEVWMIAKGRSATTSSVAKMNRKVKRAVAPDSEDEILVRLASSAYKSLDGKQSELANFIATVHIDEQRTEPLSPEAALLLAQGYASYGGLYPYFAELGDLDVSDYQKLFTLADRFSGFDIPTANLRLGEVHSFLAMLALLHERGSVPEKDLLSVCRTGIDRFLAATDAVAWTVASLTAVDDLARLASPKVSSRDAAIEALLIGNSASLHRRDLFAQVLTLQKAPSLDALYTIWSDASKMGTKKPLVDEVQRQIASFVVLPIPKAWRSSGDRKKYLELFNTAQALAIVTKIREKQAKRKPNPADLQRLSGELTGEMEPWVELAMVSRIYARYLDPTDLLVSEDPMLVRKHQFTDRTGRSGHDPWFPVSALLVSDQGEGSHFTGGLAEFAVSAGDARAKGNHIGGRGGPFAAAIFTSVRGTDWSLLTPPALQSFGATIRLAREWIVQSAIAPPARQALEEETLGLLSLSRRDSLLDALTRHDWAAVWKSVSMSDLYFLGEGLLQDTSNSGKLASLWASPAVAAMRQVALRQKDLDALGSVAPTLNGCPQPRLRRYAPYEDYERYYLATRIAQRASELKLYLAWIADNGAWQPGALEAVSATAADTLLKSSQMRDAYDWRALIESYGKLSAEGLEPLLKE